MNGFPFPLALSLSPSPSYASSRNFSPVFPFSLDQIGGRRTVRFIRSFSRIPLHAAAVHKAIWPTSPRHQMQHAQFRFRFPILGTPWQRRQQQSLSLSLCAPRRLSQTCFLRLSVHSWRSSHTNCDLFSRIKLALLAHTSTLSQQEAQESGKNGKSGGEQEQE